MPNQYYFTQTALSCNPKAKSFTLNTFEIRALKKGEKEGKEENKATAIKELYRIIWIKEGSGTLYADMHTYSISSDTIFLYKAGPGSKTGTGGTDGWIYTFFFD